MFDQGEIVWRYLSGLDPAARHEFELAGEVVAYWQDRWRGGARPERGATSPTGSPASRRQIRPVSEQRLQPGRCRAPPGGVHRSRSGSCRGRLQPALTQMNREIYRRARESSVRGAYARLEEILADEGRTLAGHHRAHARGGTGRLLAHLPRPRPARSASSPRAMAVVGSGELDHPVHATSRDEIGELARAFGRMTESLRQNVAQLERTQAQLVQSEKLASIGEMSAAVAHGLRNPLASLRAAAQLVRRHPDSPAAARAPRRHHRGGGPARPPDQPPAELQPAGAVPSRLRERAAGWSRSLLPAFAEPMRERRRRASSGRCPPTCPRCGWTRCSSSRRSSRSSPTRSTPCRRAARLRLGALVADERRAGAARDRRRGDATPAAASPTMSCRRCASRSSPLGRRAPAWASPSPSGTSSRTAAGWRSRAARARAPRSGSACPRGARGVSGTVLIVDDERTLARAMQGVPASSRATRPRSRATRSRRSAAGDAAARRGLLRRAASRHERHRAPAPDPRVRPGDPGHHHDRLRHHRRRGRGGEARRVRLPEEAGGPRGAQAPGRPRPGALPAPAGALLLPPAGAARDVAVRRRHRRVAGHARGARPGAADRGAGRDAAGPHHRRDRHRQGAGRPHHPRRRARARPSPSSR